LLRVRRHARGRLAGGSLIAGITLRPVLCWRARLGQAFQVALLWGVPASWRPRPLFSFSGQDAEAAHYLATAVGISVLRKRPHWLALLIRSLLLQLL